MAAYGTYYAMGPLLNSFLLTFGPTIAPMTAAGIAWRVKEVAYQGIHLELEFSMRFLHVFWEGSSHSQWEQAMREYSLWARETSESCRQMAISAEGVNVAYLTALIQMPPFPLVVLNRVTYYALEALNISLLYLLAIIIEPILIALNIEYEIMRIAAATAMVQYDLAIGVVEANLPNFHFIRPSKGSLLPLPPYIPGGESTSSLAALSALATVAVIPATLFQPAPPPPEIIMIPPKPEPIASEPVTEQPLLSLFTPMPSATSVSNTTSTQASQTSSTSTSTTTHAFVKTPMYSYTPFPRKAYPPAETSPKLNTGYNLQGSNKDLIGNLLSAAAGARGQTESDQGMGMAMILEEEELKEEEQEVTGFIEEIGLNSPESWATPRISLKKNIQSSI